MTVGWDDRTVTVRCPTLLGAIIAKAASSTEIVSATQTARLKHKLDLILLLDLAARYGVPPTDDLTPKDRKCLRSAIAPLADPHHPAWASAQVPGDVRDVLARLLGSDP